MENTTAEMLTLEPMTIDDITGGQRPSHDEIARLAYHAYEMRGRQDGRHVEDWLLAEDELTRRYWLIADNT